MVFIPFLPLTQIQFTLLKTNSEYRLQCFIQQQIMCKNPLRSSGLHSANVWFHSVTMELHKKGWGRSQEGFFVVLINTGVARLQTLTEQLVNWDQPWEAAKPGTG